MAVFNSKKQGSASSQVEANGQSKSIIEKGTSITGNIVTSGNVYVNGELNGDIKCTAKVAVGKDGKITGEINATQAIIEGTFEGKLKVAEQLILRATSSVKGEWSAGSLIVDAGAMMNGTSSMDVAPKTIKKSV